MPFQYWCHQCNRTFERSVGEGDAQCPRCQGEFTELIEEDDNTSGAFAGDDPRMFAMGNLFGSRPPEEQEENESGEDEEIRQFPGMIFQIGGGGVGARQGFMSSPFQTATVNNPFAEVEQLFQMLAGVHPGPRTPQQSQNRQQQEQEVTEESGERRRSSARGQRVEGEGERRSASPRTRAVRMEFSWDPIRGFQSSRTEEDGETIIEEMNQPEQQQQTEGAPSAAEPIRASTRTRRDPMDFPSLLQHIFSQTYGGMGGEFEGGDEWVIENPLMRMFGMAAGGNPGDYVTNQRALDDILTRLMEQTAGKHAPPSASEEAISKLPREPVSVEDLEAQRDCPVCQEDFHLGDQMVRMPCKHRFHEPCIVEWLKINGTCPVCRFSIVSNEENKKDEVREGSSSTSVESESNRP